MKNNLNLPESPVVFEPEHHTYLKVAKQLSGVQRYIKWPCSRYLRRNTRKKAYLMRAARVWHADT